MMENDHKLQITDEFMDWEIRDEGFPLHKHIIAGSMAGIMEHLGMFPVDTVKTHMQASHRVLGFN
jgi:solute carrier family 25 iron transporter 28/37